MKVAFITSFRPDSANGVHVAAATLARAVGDAGVQVEFWHFTRARDEVAVERHAAGFDVAMLPFPTLPGSRQGHLRRWPRTTDAWTRERAAGLDGLHLFSVFQPESWYLTRRTDVRWCISPQWGYTMFHQRRVRSFVKRPLWPIAERRIVTGARFVHALTPREAGDIRRLVPDASIEIVPNAVPLPAEMAPLPADPLWLFIGRFDVRIKGLDALLGGYALARKTTALPPLLLRGPDDRGGVDYLRERVERLGLGDAVRIGGFVTPEERDRLLAECTLFLHPSRSEGIPFGAIEALAAGRPVAVTPGTNLADAVEASGAGWRVASVDDEAVAETLVTVARATRAELESAAAAARALATSDYSLSSVGARFAALYERHFGVT